jgi:hypothetical protein
MIHPRFDPEAGVCFFRFSCTFTCGNQLSFASCPSACQPPGGDEAGEGLSRKAEKPVNTTPFLPRIPV